MVHGRLSGRVRVRAGCDLPIRWIIFALAVPAALILTAGLVHGESSPGPARAREDCCPWARPASGGMVHPAGVPDLADPTVQASFVPLDTVSLNGDPNFPGLLDEGFASRGDPSGTFTEGGPEGALYLLERLQESHQQSGRLARLRPAARRQ